MSDLDGRSQGYRGKAVRCPGCAEPMQRLALAGIGTEVDVCVGCFGLWVDWFDGDLRSVADEALRTEPALAAAPTLRNEARALGACPRCTRQLVSEAYQVPARGAEPPRKTGARLLRCEDCMGAFVARPSAELLASLAPEFGREAERAPATSEGGGGWLAALKGLFRS